MCAPLPVDLLLNGLGQRVYKSTGSGSTHYLYDDAGHLIGEYDNNGNVIQAAH